MSAAVEILAPTRPERLKAVFKGLRKTRVVRVASNRTDERMLVAWLADLDVASHRRELLEQVERSGAGGAGVPFVLLSANSEKARSYQVLEMLTQWGALAEFYLAPNMAAVQRMVRARLAGAESKLIASVQVDGDRLVIWSCEPKRYVAVASEIPVLAELDAKQLKSFSLNDSGSRLHWEANDIDLDLDAIRYYADPVARKTQDRARRDEAAKYAGAIRSFRDESGLKQTDIAGLTERQVRRVEQGESIPRSSTLTKLAAAHRCTLDRYLEELAKRCR